jgi:hypothetical protein
MPVSCIYPGAPSAAGGSLRPVWRSAACGYPACGYPAAGVVVATVWSGSALANNSPHRHQVVAVVVVVRDDE